MDSNRSLQSKIERLWRLRPKIDTLAQARKDLDVQIRQIRADYVENREMKIKIEAEARKDLDAQIRQIRADYDENRKMKIKIEKSWIRKQFLLKDENSLEQAGKDLEIALTKLSEESLPKRLICRVPPNNM